jgi:aspartyl/asparaginyl beta-hydroxylase (cupin superfamily)
VTEGSRQEGVARWDGEPEPPHFRIDGPYESQRPGFYDPDQFPWIQTLRQNWRVIRGEYEADTRLRGTSPMPSFKPDPVELPGWRSVNLLTWSRRHRENRPRYPRTTEILDAIPGLASAFLNLLEPGTRIPLHQGDANIAFRCHLGLIVPGPVDECGIQVQEERRGWSEGEVLVFEDAHPHFAWNDTEHERVILSIDVVKPEFALRARHLSGRVIASILLTFVETRFPALRRLPRACLRPASEALAFAYRIHLWLRGDVSWSRPEER